MDDCEAIGWTEERTEELKKLWSSGLSCGAIAHKIGNVTRNAVIGKVTRLHLPKREGQKPGPRPKSVWKAAPSKSVPPLAKVKPSAREVPFLPRSNPSPTPLRSVSGLPESLMISMADLQPHHCRWIAGDPRTEFPFCGHDRVEVAMPGKKNQLSPYCTAHTALASNSIQAKREPSPVP